MTVRLEELLAAATDGPWEAGDTDEHGWIVDAPAEGFTVAETTGRDAALIALAPDAVRLLIDMGKALRRHQTMGYAPGEDVQMRPELEDLLARLDRLGNTT